MEVTYPSFKIQLEWSEGFPEILQCGQMRPFLPWATAAFVPRPCQFVLSHNHSVSVLRARTHAFTSSVEPAPVPLHQRPSRNSWQMNRWTNKLNLKVIIYSRSKIWCYWRRVLLNLVSNERAQADLCGVMISEQKRAINSELWNHHPGLTLDLERRQNNAGQDRAQSRAAGVKWADTNLLDY